MSSLLEAIENSLHLIDDALNELKSSKIEEYKRVEDAVAERLGDEVVYSHVNQEREGLLDELDARRRNDLDEVSTARFIKFRPNDGFKALLDFELIISCRFLAYKNGFSLHRKVLYMHLLGHPREYVDFDLFDIKYPHSAIKMSSLVSSNRIFLLIALTNTDYLLQVHQINRSSFQSCRQLVKKSLFKYDFEFVSSRIVGVFNYRYIETYDLNLSVLERIDYLTNEGRFLSYKSLCTNGVEFIIDYNYYYRIYDSALSRYECLGQVGEPSQPFYIDLSEDLDLVNISKHYLVYLTPDKHMIRFMSRVNGHFTASFSINRIYEIPEANFYLRLSFYVDFFTSIVYFKSDTSSSIHCLNPNNQSMVNAQDEFDSSDRFQFVVLLDNELNCGEQTILLLKRTFSTQNLKFVYIF